MQFDAAELASGSYSYRLMTTGNFDLSTVSGVQAGRVLVFFII